MQGNPHALEAERRRLRLLAMYKAHRRLMLWAFVPVVLALAIRIPFFPDSNFYSWPLLLILAPATEEALKLFLIVVASLVGHLLVASRTRETPERRAAGSRAALFLLLLPAGVGVFYGTWEHFSAYPGEPPIALLARLLAHPGYTFTAFAVCLLVWRKGYSPAAGLWIGTLAGIVPHAIFNFGAIAPPDWYVVHTIAYSLPVAILCFIIGLFLLRHEFQYEPASDPGRLLANGEAPVGADETPAANM